MQKLEQATVKYTVLAYWHQSCVGGRAALYQPFQYAISCHSAASWSIIAFLLWSFAYSFSARFIMLPTFLKKGWVVFGIWRRGNLGFPVLQFSVGSHLQVRWAKWEKDEWFWEKI